MDTSETIAKVSEYTEKAKEGFEKFEEYIEALHELEEKQKSLTELQEMIKKIGWVAKLGAVTQVVAVGLAFLQFLFPEEAPEDKILEKLNEIDAKLEGIRKAIGDLASQNQISNDLQTLKRHFGRIESAHGWLREYAKLKAAGAPRAEIMRKINALDLLEFDAALQDIQDAVLGDGLATPLLQEIYEHTDGDAIEMAKYQAYLTHMAQSAVQVQSSVRVLQEAEAHGDAWTDANAVILCAEIEGDARDPDSMSGKVRRIAAELEDWALKGLERSEQTSNVSAVLDEHLEANIPSHEDCNATARDILDALAKRFTWLRFCVLVYPSSDAPNYHVMKSRGHAFVLVHRFDVADSKGEGANIVVYGSSVLPEGDAEPDAPEVITPEEADVVPYNAADPDSVRPTSAEDFKRVNFDMFAHLIDAANRDFQNHPLQPKRRKIGKYLGLWPVMKDAGKNKAQALEEAQEFFDGHADQEVAQARGDWHEDFVWLGFPCIPSRALHLEEASSSERYFGLASHVPVALHRSAQSGARFFDNPARGPDAYEGLFALLAYPTTT